MVFGFPPFSNETPICIHELRGDFTFVMKSLKIQTRSWLFIPVSLCKVPFHFKGLHSSTHGQGKEFLGVSQFPLTPKINPTQRWSQSKPHPVNCLSLGKAHSPLARETRLVRSHVVLPITWSCSLCQYHWAEPV